MREKEQQKEELHERVREREARVQMRLQRFEMLEKVRHVENLEKVTRFVSGLRRKIQDVVYLYEYSTLSKVLHLTLKVENQLKRKNEAKKNTSYNDYYYKSWKGKKEEKMPSKAQDSTSKNNSTKTIHDKPPTNSS